MLLNKALIISALLFQAQPFAELFALLHIRLIPSCQCSAEREAGWDAFGPAYPNQISTAPASKGLAESTVLLVCVSGYFCLLQLVDFLMYHNWELIRA